MKTAAQFGEMGAEIGGGRNSVIDTSFVLFFLAIEFGRSFGALSIDGVVLAVALLMVTVLPYFTLSGERPGFANWLFGRTLILGLAFVLGLLFKQTVGVILPEEFRFLPMTLLIIAAVFSTYVQFHSFLRFRLAK